MSKPVINYFQIIQVKKNKTGSVKFVFLFVKTIHFLFIGISIHSICKQIRVRKFL